MDTYAVNSKGVARRVYGRTDKGRLLYRENRVMPRVKAWLDKGSDIGAGIAVGAGAVMLATSFATANNAPAELPVNDDKVDWSQMSYVEAPDGVFRWCADSPNGLTTECILDGPNTAVWQS